ncbi:hypothetical protein K502DRAFT_2658 [Neoconidiobolus thromboides FSU 785]|nr:hypothetical protein K502DRAFT_2658 [Neoconidiobolus thromboides FSU 785]
MSSWFGGSAPKLDMDVIEREYTVMNELFTRVQDTCRSKCISTEYHEAQISKGEANCIDRCVAKYIQTATKIAQESRGM